eukprot:CAMPEP_0185495944 /NCGR_PEP_ID=MMETSP1366-20130426/17933_1 /TAXON_ID=38817 /ORGANISM="Gephyrocapsa oceanica, Strain RCC1303" /LENGTH=39 /DNA_ID= /DNA_START= /DNA_END= /DNA_ORIENTATION=
MVSSRVRALAPSAGLDRSRPISTGLSAGLRLHHLRNVAR